MKCLGKKIVAVILAISLFWSWGIVPQAQETEITENLQNDIQVEIDSSELKLNYFAVQSSSVAIPGEQQIAVSLGDGAVVVETAEITLLNQETQERILVQAEEIQDDAIRFAYTFSEETQIGTYVAESMSYIVRGKENTLVLSEVGITAQFGVGKEIETKPDAYAVREDIVELETYTAEGEEISEDEIASAIEEAQKNANSVPKSKNADLVVVLDPGHDSRHSGAHRGDLKEEQITLKIAQYCREELEQYVGVTVYMTREGEDCPYPGTTSTECNKSRVAFAKDVGCDIYVSIHINSSESLQPQGVEIYYPNTNYNAQVGTEGQGVAEKVLEQLVSLGLANRGIKLNDDDGYTYPDGSRADDLTVINNNKLNGIPAILIEHAFISNVSDVNNFLSSDEQLKKLGVADAGGIAQYYGLTKLLDSPEITITGGPSKALVEIQNVNTVTGCFDVEISDIEVRGGVKKIQVPIWSEADQSDIYWYDAVRQQDGTFKVHMDVANHDCNFGTFMVDTYLLTKEDSMDKVDGKVVSVPKPTTEVSVSEKSNGSIYQAKAYHVPGTFGASLKRVQFAVWSEENGQDDLVWYEGKASQDTFIADVPMNRHSGNGLYYVHVYATYSNGRTEFVGGTGFHVTRASATVNITNLNTVTGNFDVIVSDITAVGGIGRIQVPVWSKPNQSDIVWYDAQRQTDGTYKVHVDVANHNCNFGTYNVHTYVQENNGALINVGMTTVSVPKPTTEVSVSEKSNGSIYQAKAYHVPGTFGASLKRVQFAVWSEENGQDDLVWYEGKASQDTFIADVPMNRHSGNGLYYVHVYATYSNGRTEFVGGTGFHVTRASATVNITNLNTVTGNFDVIVSDITAVGGIGRIQVPVWSKPNQSDIVWYDAQRQTDGTYKVHVDVANHNCNFGTYNVHTYVQENNGALINVGMTTVSVPKPTMELTVYMNSSGTVYKMEAYHVPGTFGDSLKKVEFAVWSDEGGQDDLIWYRGEASSDKFVSVVPISNHNTAGTYYVHVYATYSNGNMEFLGGRSFLVENVYPISGKSAVSSEDLVAYYSSRNEYPTYYQDTDAPDLQAFCEIYMEECRMENIRAEVAFCQAMKETNFLQYGGDVQISQFNFAGIGASGNGNPGNSYGSVREGIRAHIQHLKAYANTEDLVNECVDQRFDYVTRGCAPYVEWLGQYENPSGAGWATAVGYGISIRNDYMKILLGY